MGSEGDDDGLQKESKGEGTGEKYVKSSGMKADGGDFDASNPGAGREADRESYPYLSCYMCCLGVRDRGEYGGVRWISGLMRTILGLLGEKGVHHTPDPGHAEPSEKSENGDGKEGKEKMGLRQKIKAKLHKN